jgi:hypothetical protein
MCPHYSSNVVGIIHEGRVTFDLRALLITFLRLATSLDTQNSSVIYAFIL